MTEMTALLEVFKVAGTAGVLWVACWYLVKSLKEQYETRIAALEQAMKEINEEKRQLQEKLENILLDLIKANPGIHSARHREEDGGGI